MRSKAIPRPRSGRRRKYRQRHHVLHDEMESIEKPIILAAQGPCLGLGLEMAASCDFRFCTPQAHFGLPEVGRLGVIAGSGGISRVTRLVGPHWSKWISMAGKNVDADTASADRPRPRDLPGRRVHGPRAGVRSWARRDRPADALGWRSSPSTSAPPRTVRRPATSSASVSRRWGATGNGRRAPTCRHER